MSVAEAPLDRLQLADTEVVHVSSVVIDSSEILYVPSRLLALEQFLLVGDRPNPALHVLRLDSAAGVRWRRSVGRTGEGPGEYVSIAGLAPDIDGSRAWAYDYTLRRLTRVSLDTSQIGVDRVDVVRLTGEDLQPMDRVLGRVIALRSSFVGVLHDASGAGLVLFDSSGRQQRLIGDFTRAADSVPGHLGGSDYVGQFCYADGAPAIGVAFLRYGRISIYDLDGKYTSDAQVPLPFQSRYVVDTVTGREELTGPETRTGYSGCTATKNHIFALFSGKRHQDYRPSPAAVVSEDVHVFTWEGRFVGALRLDHEAISIAVDPSERRLFTGVVGTRPQLRVAFIQAALQKMREGK